MSKKIFCKKLNKELPALNNPPMPGPKGIELMNSISEEHGKCGNPIKQLS